MATVDMAVPRSITVDQALRGRRTDVPGLAFQLGLLGCLFACLAFIVLLLATVFSDGLDTFKTRGFVIDAVPHEFERAVNETWTFLVHPHGIVGWLLLPAIEHPPEHRLRLERQLGYTP